MKSEHLCCNFSHFVLLLLCCSQALGNLFSQKPALALTLEKTALREAGSRMLVWVVVVLLTSVLEVPGNGDSRPPCILASLEEQPGGPEVGRNLAQILAPALSAVFFVVEC